MRLALALFVLLILAPPVRADDEYEVMLRASLHVTDPVAESLFVEGTRLRDASEYRSALVCFRQVTKRLPEFWPAYRRAASMEFHLANRARAIADLRWLVERDTIGYTLGALADALVHAPQNDQPDSAEIEAARLLIARALAQLPDEPSLLTTEFWTGLAASDLAAMRHAVAGLHRVDGSSPWTWYITAVMAIQTRDISGARAAVEKARQAGLSTEALASLETPLGSLERVRTMNTIGNAALWSLPGWLALLGLLTVAGLALSRATLAATDRAMTGPAGDPIGTVMWLRRAYSGVIAAYAVNYHMSLPLLLLLVPACGAGLWWVMFYSLMVPRAVQTVVIVATFAVVGPLLRSLFVRDGEPDLGDALDLDAQPRLRAALEEVARRVGTRPVDSVFLTAGTDVTMFERRDWLRGLRSERRLVLGVGVLEGMKLGAWKAILAHEYGHFVNQDSAGGGLALAVRRSVRARVLAMDRGGVASWYNPAWWFVRGFEVAFLRVSQGAARLQEVLADRCAALSYGAPAFRDGLTHVITTSVRFETVAVATLQCALRDHAPVANLYRHPVPLDGESAHEVERLAQEALAREPEADDSQPSFAERFAWAEKVSASAPPRHADPGDEDDAWSLFEDREELEVFMTSTVQSDYELQHDVEFAEAPEDPGSERPA